MSDKNNEMIEERFSEIIRERLDEKDFWEWASNWYDPSLIIDTAEDWDIETKFDELLTLERMLARKKKRKVIKATKTRSEVDYEI